MKLHRAVNGSSRWLFFLAGALLTVAVITTDFGRPSGSAGTRQVASALTHYYSFGERDEDPLLDVSGPLFARRQAELAGLKAKGVVPRRALRIDDIDLQVSHRKVIFRAEGRMEQNFDPGQLKPGNFAGNVRVAGEWDIESSRVVTSELHIIRESLPSGLWGQLFPPTMLTYVQLSKMIRVGGDPGTQNGGKKPVPGQPTPGFLLRHSISTEQIAAGRRSDLGTPTGRKPEWARVYFNDDKLFFASGYFHSEFARLNPEVLNGFKHWAYLWVDKTKKEGILFEMMWSNEGDSPVPRLQKLKDISLTKNEIRAAGEFGSLDRYRIDLHKKEIEYVYSGDNIYKFW